MTQRGEKIPCNLSFSLMVNTICFCLNVHLPHCSGLNKRRVLLIRKSVSLGVDVVLSFPFGSGVRVVGTFPRLPLSGDSTVCSRRGPTGNYTVERRHHPGGFFTNPFIELSSWSAFVRKSLPYTEQRITPKSYVLGSNVSSPGLRRDIL